MPRFPAAQTVVVDAAGHWPDVEQPAVVAAHLDRFLAAQHSTGAAGGWTSAFANKSADDFAAAFADDVVLEATVLTRPIEGRHAVMRVMGTASEIYESLEFTHEASAGERSYLEWQSTAFGGLAIDGVTVLTRDAAGRIVRAAIHHRPLGGALRFSAELRERLTGVIDGDYFYDGAIVAEGSR